MLGTIHNGRNHAGCSVFLVSIDENNVEEMTLFDFIEDNQIVDKDILFWLKFKTVNSECFFRKRKCLFCHKRVENIDEFTCSAHENEREIILASLDYDEDSDEDSDGDSESEDVCIGDSDSDEELNNPEWCECVGHKHKFNEDTPCERIFRLIFILTLSGLFTYLIGNLRAYINSE